MLLRHPDVVVHLLPVLDVGLLAQLLRAASVYISMYRWTKSPRKTVLSEFSSCTLIILLSSPLILEFHMSRSKQFPGLRCSVLIKKIKVLFGGIILISVTFSMR